MAENMYVAIKNIEFFSSKDRDKRKSVWEVG